jgi:hypothetical protein
MSVIVITHPFEGPVCAPCLEIQLTDFRNKIKETWNRLNNDGKVGHVVRIPFKLNENLPWETPITMRSGTDLCMTHLFISVNAAAEQMAAFKESDSKPGLVDPFTGGKLQLGKN